MVSLDEKDAAAPGLAIAEWISMGLMLLAGLAAVVGFWPAANHIQGTASGTWFTVSLALAFFCLGFGAAYVLFARYRIAQSRQLARNFDRLASEAERLAARAEQRLSEREEMLTAKDSD